MKSTVIALAVAGITAMAGTLASVALDGEHPGWLAINGIVLMGIAWVALGIHDERHARTATAGVW